MNLPGGWELVLIVLVIMVLFGAKRLPEASRSLGRSMRIFKSEVSGLSEDDKKDAELEQRRRAAQEAYDRVMNSPQQASPPAATPPAASPAAPTPLPPAPPVPGVAPAPGSVPMVEQQRTP